MEATVQESVDSLASLEERIGRAVHVITDLRAQNAQMSQRVGSLEQELKKAQALQHEQEISTAEVLKERNDLEQQGKRLTQELEDMRGERKQVRGRIEKLLSQLDLLSANY